MGALQLLAALLVVSFGQTGAEPSAVVAGLGRLERVDFATVRRKTRTHWAMALRPVPPSMDRLPAPESTLV